LPSAEAPISAEASSRGDGQPPGSTWRPTYNNQVRRATRPRR
jgi:hypothetical protein